MLAKEDLDQIRHLVQDEIRQELGGRSLREAANVSYELDLRERTLRVEQELRHQRELMQQGFQLMEKRFEQMDKRFEQVDKRFEEMREDMNARFEQVDKRFEQVDKRFEQVDKRFEEVNASIKDLGRRMDRFMVWTFGMMVTFTGLILAAMRLLP